MSMVRYLTLFILSVATCLNAGGEEPQVSPLHAEWNVRDHIPLDQFTIQSHRGAGELAPENTVEAFLLGWELGTIPEADVRTTQDGVIVAFHDANFARIVRDISPEMARRGVADVTFDELRKMDVGGWMGDEFKGRRVSRMTEIYALMKGHPERKLYLDFKAADLDDLAGEVLASGVAPQVLLATREHKLIQRWKKLLPDSGTLLWIPGNEAEKRAAYAAVRATDFDGITQLQIHVRMPGDATDVQPGEPFSPSRKFLAEVSAELAAKGILFQTLPYGANDTRTYHQLLDAGLASFATDFPRITRKAVEDYYQEGNARD